MLMFEPVRSQDEIIKDLTKLKIEQEVLKKKENMLETNCLAQRMWREINGIILNNQDYNMSNSNRIYIFIYKMEAL